MPDCAWKNLATAACVTRSDYSGTKKMPRRRKATSYTCTSTARHAAPQQCPPTCAPLWKEFWLRENLNAEAQRTQSDAEKYEERQTQLLSSVSTTNWRPDECFRRTGF